MASTLIKNGLVIDPSQNINQTADILIVDGLISAIGSLSDSVADHTIDASGLVVSPGLVDMHVHLRDPGFTYKEDILSGCEAAAAGGVTSVAAMPNTHPTTDSPEVIKYILDKAESAKARVYPVASISHDLSGENLTDFEALKNCGAIAVSDDGKPVKNAYMMQQALEKAFKANIPVISHCEDMDIIQNGIMHEGEISKKLGVSGMHRSSEDSITAREIALAQATNTAIHIAHVSTKGSTEMIHDAKLRGIKVTAETCPHYFCLTHNELLKKDADYRMNPPLREYLDTKAVLKGIADGTFDCIVTDHAPHSPEEKSDFSKAPNGIVGLETSLAVCLTELVDKNIISLEKLIELMSVNPARILGIEGGTLKIGSKADIAIIDCNKFWTVDPKRFHSKSRNSAFKGKTLKGKVIYTLLGGEIVFQHAD
ncbi:MAG: dihydroorotase, multifunctional complex type [Oscillospiraceae bacterium]|nr:dihydroorotase, multifunctional complex type [Oscillospiraceae bacterium]